MKNILFLLASIVALNARAQQKQSPKLVVGIVVDQMCYDYLYRYSDKFSKGGFKRLMKNGANCRNTHYNYVPTYTGPGHASIYTGTTPANHGIVANDWMDRIKGSSVNCVQDEQMKTIGSASTGGKCSPHYLKTHTVTDQLKMTYPSAKVISMSIKDRGAILPGGHLSDGSYWYDYSSGQFITSSFFKSELPGWVRQFNETNYVKTAMERTWDPLLPIEQYTESLPDDSPYEQRIGGKTSPTFPYNLKEMSKVVSPFELFTVTPFANTYLAEFALRSIEAENLGQDNQTDMLCVSFSTPDIAGHAFGPYSVEIEDIYLRLDLEIERMLNYLDKEIGKREYVFFVTADHAVVPVPQHLVDQKLPGGYFYLNDRLNSLRNAISEAFGADLFIGEDNLNIYLDRPKMDSLGIFPREVQWFVADVIRNWDGVKAVYTAEELLSFSVDEEWKDMIKNGYDFKRSGDVIFILESGYLPKSVESEASKRGTSHGSAFNYDTQVPLLWYGKQIKPQSIQRKIEITDIAATLSQLFFIQRNGSMTGQPIIELLQD
jgi:hypothetical protein